MLAYILKRTAIAVLVAITVSLITFSMIYLSGDPALALAGETATEEDIELIRRVYGYDRPIMVQYLDWLYRAVQGDFGQSHYLKKPVSEVIFERLPTTMLLGFCALVFALTLSIPLGVLAAIRPNSMIDRAALTIAVVGQAMPSFWFALIMMLWLGIYWRLLPITGTASWANFVMPSIALGYYITPAVMRLTRAGMLEVLSTDYIRTARAKGLRPMTVLFKHALRNALIPVVTIAALSFGALFSGALITETMFSYLGMGKLIYDSILGNDYNVAMVSLLFATLLTLAANLIADVCYAWLDPRIRYA